MTVRLLAWSMWLIASLFYAYQYVLRVMPNIMINDIMDRFHIDTAILGQFSGVYYIGYSLMHLPIGIMLDRYGPRKIMTFCVLLSVTGLLPLIFSEHWAYPLVGRVLMGMGSSAAILGTFKIIRMTFEEHQFSRMLSFSVMIGLIGAIYGGAPVAYLTQLFGYQEVVQWIAMIGLILAVVTYGLLPDLNHPHQDSVWSDVKEVLSNQKVIWTCVFAGLMVGPIEGFADVWGTEFLKRVYHIETDTAAQLPSLIFIGMCFGAPVLSLFADKTRKYLMTITGAGAVMSVSFFVLIAGWFSDWMIRADFILVGICCSYQILAIYKASTYVREGVAGLTTAVANMIIMSFGYAFHSLIGFIIQAMGGAEVPEAFIMGLSMIPIGLALGTLGFLILWSQSGE